MAEVEIEKISTLVPHLRDIPHKKIWMDYDEKAEVLYVNFKKLSHAYDSDLTDDDVIVKVRERGYRGDDFLECKERRTLRRSI